MRLDKVRLAVMRSRMHEISLQASKVHMDLITLGANGSEDGKAAVDHAWETYLNANGVLDHLSLLEEALS